MAPFIAKFGKLINKWKFDSEHYKIVVSYQCGHNIVVCRYQSVETQIYGSVHY